MVDSGGAGDAYGGGLSEYMVHGDHLLFQENNAVNRGGGLLGSFITLSASRFLANASSGGGGLSVVNGSANLTNVLIAQNNASAGGGAGLRLENAPGTLTHVTIARAPRGSGSGIYVVGGASLTLHNFTLTNYTTGIDTSGGTTVEDYNLFFDNGADISGSTTSGGHSLTGQDPKLANPAGNEYHLNALSPPVGAGTDLGVTTDLDDRPRLSGRFDIGAYQFLFGLHLPLITK